MAGQFQTGAGLRGGELANQRVRGWEGRGEDRSENRILKCFIGKVCRYCGIPPDSVHRENTHT